MLFREASLTSLRHDSTRVQNGWTVRDRPPRRPLTFPPSLIYARRYLCQRICIPIFIIRNIIARTFIALVEKLRCPARRALGSFFSLSPDCPVFPRFPVPAAAAAAFAAISRNAYAYLLSTPPPANSPSPVHSYKVSSPILLPACLAPSLVGIPSLPFRGVSRVSGRPFRERDAKTCAK